LRSTIAARAFHRAFLLDCLTGAPAWSGIARAARIDPPSLGCVCNGTPIRLSACVFTWAATVAARIARVTKKRPAPVERYAAGSGRRALRSSPPQTGRGNSQRNADLRRTTPRRQVAHVRRNVGAVVCSCARPAATPPHDRAATTAPSPRRSCAVLTGDSVLSRACASTASNGPRSDVRFLLRRLAGCDPAAGLIDSPNRSSRVLSSSLRRVALQRLGRYGHAAACVLPQLDVQLEHIVILALE